MAQQKLAYIDALKGFSPAAVDAACRASAAENEWWPPLKRLLTYAGEYAAAERMSLALPAPGEQASSREDFLARCGRLGFAVATMRDLGHDNWRPLFEAHMRDTLDDADLVAGLRRLQGGQPLRPRVASGSPPAEVVDLTKRLEGNRR